MEVYIEYVIIDNLIINTLIMLATVKTMHLRKSRTKIALAAAFGTVAAICMPLLNIHGAWLWMYKIAVALMMTVIIVRPIPVKRYFSTLALMLLYTFGAGGAAFGLVLLMGGSMVDSIELSYISSIPVGVIMALLAVAGYYIYRTAAMYSTRKNLAPYIRRVELVFGGRLIELEGFVDSGNMVFDPKSGLPVMVAYGAKIMTAAGIQKPPSKTHEDDTLMGLDEGYLSELDSEILDTLRNVMGGHLPSPVKRSQQVAASKTIETPIKNSVPTDEGLKGGKVKSKSKNKDYTLIPCGSMEYQTASGRTAMKLFRPDMIKIYSDGKANIIYDVLVGFGDQKLGGGAFDILIHPSLV